MRPIRLGAMALGLSTLVLGATALHVAVPVLADAPRSSPESAIDASGDQPTSTIICGFIDQNHWTVAGSPYIVTCHAEKLSGSLTIDPGVEVRFDAGTSIDMWVPLYAEGTQDSPILFTSNGALEPGFWDGLSLVAAAGGSVLRHVTVEYGRGILVQTASMYLTDCDIHHNAASGVEVWSGTATITHCNITYNTAEQGGGVMVLYGDVILHANNISWNSANSGGGGVYAYGFELGASVDLTDSRIANNSQNSFCGGGVLFDSADGHISGNLIVNNSSGSDGGGLCAGGGGRPYVVVADNVIAGNSTVNETGAIATDGYTTIMGNLIVGNASANTGGLHYSVPEGGWTPSIQPVFCNTFAWNSGLNGVYTAVESPFTDNTFWMNEGYELENGAAWTVNAKENYWGTTKDWRIQTHIFDYFDEPARGVARFRPFLLEAPPCAPPLLDLPFDYDGRLTGPSSALWDVLRAKATAVFDHEVPAGGKDRQDGYDFGVARGTPVLAAAAGTVVSVGSEPETCDGQMVRIVHGAAGGGIATVYCHLCTVDVAVGDSVTARSQVGTSGGTEPAGCEATRPGIHFEVQIHEGLTGGWVPIDPSGWPDRERSDPWAVDPEGAPSFSLWRYPAPELSSSVKP